MQVTCCPLTCISDGRFQTSPLLSRPIFVHTCGGERLGTGLHQPISHNHSMCSTAHRAASPSNVLEVQSSMYLARDAYLHTYMCTHTVEYS